MANPDFRPNISREIKAVILSALRVPGAVLYARVSTGEQAQHGTSLESQKDACRQKALGLSLPIVAEYEDAGVSGGFLLTRQGMQAALADIQAGRADTLVCANLSRYSRDVGHQQEIKKAVRAAGGRLVFCDMDFDDTPEGDLAFGIMGGFAEYEKAVIKKRTYGGRVRLAQAGVQTSRVHSPLGYHVVSTADVLRGDYPADARGTYRVVEAEGVIVREMFTRYGSGAATLTGLARWLNESGTPTRLRAAFWRIKSVRYILSNPVYKGLAAFGKRDHVLDEVRVGTPGAATGKLITGRRTSQPADPSTWITWPVPALVSEDLWERVQAKFGENQSQKGGNPRRVRMLAGRVFCPECNAPLHVLRTPKRTPAHQNSYVCAEYRKQSANPNAPGCLPTLYPVAVMEEAAMGALLDAAARPQAIAEARAVYRQKAQEEQKQSIGGLLGDLGDEFAQLTQKITDLGRKQKAAVECQIAGVMAGADPGAYSAVFAEISQERSVLEARKACLVAQNTRPAPSQNTRPAPSQNTRPAPSQNTRPAPSQAHALVTEDRQILADMALVLKSDLVTDARKREIVGLVIAAVRPLREGKAYQRKGSWGAEVEFLPGVLECCAPASGEGQEQSEEDQMSQTFQLSGKKCCLNFMVA